MMGGIRSRLVDEGEGSGPPPPVAGSPSGPPGFQRAASGPTSWQRSSGWRGGGGDAGDGPLPRGALRPGGMMHVSGCLPLPAAHGCWCTTWGL